MSCNKIYFASKTCAVDHISEINNNAKHYKNFKKVLKRLRAYECFYCDGWHLTSMTKRDSKALGKYQERRREGVAIIKSLRKNPTMEHLFAHQEPWMILHIDDTRSWVSFTKESGFTGRIVLK